MTDWSIVFLGIIAVSTLIMAAIQIGVLLVAARAARSASAGVERLEAQLAPLVHRAELLGEQASDAMDRVTRTLVRTEQAVDAVGAKVLRATDAVAQGVRGPVGTVAAVAAGVRAAAQRFSGSREPGRELPR